MTGTSYRLLIFLLIFSPLAFGAVEQWSLTILETTSLLAFSIFILQQIQSKKAVLYDVPGITPLVLFLAYIAFQLIPLPAAFVKIVSPGAYTVYSETIGVVKPLSWIPITIHNKATLMEFFRISSYAFIYIITVQLLTSKDLLRRTMITITIFGAVLSLFGIIQHLLFNDKIYWIRELTAGGKPFGPYVNRNHYAGFMGMIFPLALSLFLFHKPDFSYGSIRERVTYLLSQKITNIRILLGFASILMALSVFLSLSRGGILSLSLSMIFFGLLVLLKTKKSKRGFLIILIFVLILYAVGWFGWENIFGRFEKIRYIDGDIREQRLVMWKDSLNIARDFPITGTGFGTFIYIYPKYRTRMGNAVVDHAHNDYIEFLSEGGLIAAVFFGWFLIAVFSRSFAMFLKRREPYSIYIFTGSVTAIVSMLIHSVTDFNLHIGANGLFFFFLLGLTVSAAYTRFYEDETSYLKTVILPQLKLIFGAVTAFLIVSLLFNSAFLAGQFFYTPLKDKNLEIPHSTEELQTMKNDALKATRFDPLEAEYQYFIARIDRLLGNRESATEYHRKALQLEPVNAEFLQMYGLVLSEMRQDGAAERLLLAGIRYDRQSTLGYQIYAPWLIARDRKDAGIDYMKQAISMEPEKTRQYITIMVLNGLTDEEIRHAIPEHSVPYVHFADYLVSTGNDSIAEDVYLRSLAYTEKEEDIHASVFMKIYNYYRERRRYDSALYVMKKAADKFPNNVKIRLTAALAYEEAEIHFSAVDEYKQILLMDPDNQRAKQRLEKLNRKSSNEQ